MGLPYNVASRVITNTFSCPLCGRREISGSDEFNGVLSEHNQTIPDAANHRTFGSILLVPGPGHMEINMTKATFKLLWHFVLQDLGKQLRFRSAKAQTSCQNASDHHKAWQMIEVLFWGTGAELIIPYVKECQRSGIRPDVAGFGEWLSNRTDKNFIFLGDVIFTYVTALFLFRRGNHSLAFPCFSKFSDLFFGLNMTQYQELFLRYHHILHSCPDVIRSFLKDNLSYSVSGADDRGEGGDFILDAKNRRIQMWMPPGLPHHWQRICRNFDTLDSIRDHMTSAPTSSTASSHHVDPSKETRYWRHHLRQSAYLGTPMSTRPRVSLGAKVLDMHLSSFAKTCQDSNTKYVEETTSGKPLGSHHQLRVFVLAGEREEASDVAKKTNSQLCGLIEDTTGRIHDAGTDELAGSLRREYVKDVRTVTKAVLLTFLQRADDTLTEVLEQEEAQERADDAP